MQQADFIFLGTPNLQQSRKINFKFLLKAWRNWPKLLAKDYCFHLKSGVTPLTIANDSETNNVCQAMLASFAKALPMWVVKTVQQGRESGRCVDKYRYESPA